MIAGIKLDIKNPHLIQRRKPKVLSITFRKNLTHLLIIALLIAFTNMASAVAMIPAAPKIAAKGYLLIDYNSGNELTSKNADMRMEPASLTKMMSSYVIASALESNSIKLDDKVIVSEKAWRAPGSRMFIEVNTAVTVEQLLKGLIVQSGNDATIALAEHVAGSEEAFASLMNQYAAQIGMTSTHFVNSTGLPHKNHYTTPRDMAMLARALIHDFPEHYRMYSIKKFNYNNINQYNRNRLLWKDKSVDGVKTGHTESAGYCLVASALRNDMRLISVVLGTKSEKARERASLKLLGYGFRFFESYRIYSAGEAVIEPEIWYGASDKVVLGFPDDLYITIPRGKRDKIKTTTTYEDIISAPVSKGQELGNILITLDGKSIIDRPLVVLEDVPEGSLWSRFIDYIKLLFFRLFS